MIEFFRLMRWLRRDIRLHCVPSRQAGPPSPFLKTEIIFQVLLGYGGTLKNFNPALFRAGLKFFVVWTGGIEPPRIAPQHP